METAVGARSSGTSTRYFGSFGDDLPPPGLYHRILRDLEVPLIGAALAATRGNQIKAAESSASTATRCARNPGPRHPGYPHHAVSVPQRTLAICRAAAAFLSQFRNSDVTLAPRAVPGGQ